MSNFTTFAADFISNALDGACDQMKPSTFSRIAIPSIEALESSEYAIHRELAAQATRTFINLYDYDREGNWIGAVSNENGWTA